KARDRPALPKPARPPAKLAGSPRDVEGRATNMQSGLVRGTPPPSCVRASRQHGVDHVVAAGDAVEHRPHGGRVAFAQMRCQIDAMPWPTPMHIVASPYSASRRSISRTSVLTSRAPLLPSGWPRAIAPPL